MAKLLADAKQLEKDNEKAYRHEYLGEVTSTGVEVFNNIITRPVKDDEIARYQAFSNGNKRTALLATVDFLQNNFLKIDISPEKQMEDELYGISLRIANGQYDKPDVIEFIKANAVVNFKMIDYVVKNSNIFKK